MGFVCSSSSFSRQDERLFSSWQDKQREQLSRKQRRIFVTRDSCLRVELRSSYRSGRAHSQLADSVAAKETDRQEGLKTEEEKF